MTPFGIYVHVPYCASRCGYCDFNTYTATELGGGASQQAYPDDAITEIRRARQALGDGGRPADTVFFGGGTPTLLPAADLGRILSAIREEFGLAPDAEVTTEANPESVDARYLERLREHGFTRVSFGMQSARAHVLSVLDRRHRLGVPERRVAEARAAGFEHINLDLIYGTPGETDDDWRASLDAALSATPDHVSAYSLIVERGTALGRKVASGALPVPDDDVLADRYLIADEMLTSSGLRWYEVSNWAFGGGVCRHNLGYWHGFDWWGIGPGAHSHVGGERWWNVRHPRAYAGALAAGELPVDGRECLDVEARYTERVMLAVRMASGLPLAELSPAGREAASVATADGLLNPDDFARGNAILTLRGRLLADAVVRQLLA